MVGQLLKANISAHREFCTDELECAEWLLTKKIDLAILSASIVAQISTTPSTQSDSPEVLAVTEAVKHSKVITNDRQFRSLTELAAEAAHSDRDELATQLGASIEALQRALPQHLFVLANPSGDRGSK